jgi:chromosomal replication initiator protein
MEDSQVAALSLQLAERIGPTRFEVWIESQARLCIEATTLTIHAANDFVRVWLRSNLADEIRAVWQAMAGPTAAVEYAVEEASQHAQVEEPAERTATAPPVRRSEQQLLPQVRSNVTSEPAAHRVEFTFGNFVVGPSNEYAFRSAEFTGCGRQQASPLTFFGETGVGKTHLLKAILREYRRSSPRSSAAMLTAEQFTTGFVEAVRGTGLPSFRQKCRGAQLLVIDDVQFFIGKDRTLEEFQHTVDAMLGEGRQLVFSADRSLADLRGLGSELVSRLAGGLVCEIESPEFATRREIVRRYAGEIGLDLCDDVMNTVAAQITSGARELRGALYRLQAIGWAFDKPITRETAERALADLARHSARPVRLADVEKAVCEVFGMERSQLRSDRKGRAVSDPRMLAMWLARKYTRAAWSEIAEHFGRKSHSTVISAHRRVEKLISSQAHVEMGDRECGVEEAIRKLEQALRTA